MIRKPNILFVTPILAHPPKGGPQLRIENSIKALNEVSNLYVLSRASLEDIGGDDAVDYYKKYCKQFLFSPLSSLTTSSSGALWHKVKRRLKIFLYEKIIQRNADYNYILKIAIDEKVDVIWLGYGNLSYPLLKYLKKKSNFKVVVDTDSVWSRFVLRGLPYSRSLINKVKILYSGSRKQREESWGTNMADITTAVSEVDLQYYQSLTSRDNAVAVFSNVIDLDTYKVKPDNKNIQTPSIYLAGSYGPNSPMEEAALWTIEKVLPLVWQEIPNLHFYIVGTGITQKIKNLSNENITIVGSVPSVLPYLYNVNVALVPLKFESGTRFKILEAGACKIPIVSTTLGAEGLSVVHETDILIADTPESFADSIIDLVTDLEKGIKLSENCYKIIDDKYSVSTAINEAKVILKMMGFE